MNDLVSIHGTGGTQGTASSDTGADTTAALAMVGKTARFRDASSELTSDGAKWTFTAAAGSIGQILNAKGEVVRTISIDTEAEMDSGKKTGSFEWDGSTSSGELADTGTYYLQIVDATKSKTTGTAYIEGKIDNVAFDVEGNPRLVSDDLVWSLKDVFTLT